MSYRNTRKILNQCKDSAMVIRNKLEILIAAKRKDRKNFTEIETELDAINNHISKLNSMISDVQLAIDWLRLGHNPGPRQGIHRKSIDQLTIPVDPLRMQSYAQPAACGSPTTLTDSERKQIDDALAVLSPREKQCFTLKHGLCLSLRQIAEELQISRGTAQEYIEKAERKLKEPIQVSLFQISS
ncbi:sigma-70 family RNA polymerase sigma factor [Paenibacillus graminis]|uniref:sigma-70 family RNA polymerase sigma factor n=1 Tax=Paenibacillus graminis TaxID=189425 RepID=UPI002DBED160|nr:sigma-70 family RNA polymerase sigma factor [Paenibacillus graminis]MEC0170854.1 sigma-70 family RNA polymerase sigma factor [Paenibacillus graminis]